MSDRTPTACPVIRPRRRGLLPWLAVFVAAPMLQPVSASDRLIGGATPNSDATMMSRPLTSFEGGAGYSRVRTAQGLYRVSTRFRSFSGDPLAIAFQLEPEAARQSMYEFGVSPAELDALMHACLATKGCDQKQFDRHTERYYREHALQLRPVPGQRSRLYVDVAEVVRRNRSRVRPVAAALQRLAAERGYDSQQLIEAAVAMVQTGLAYKEPSMKEDGRQILGFYPPPRALEQGYGDCDTKSALLAAILLNLTDARLVGVHVPQHYVLGIAAKPRPDQAFIRYRGEPYVLIEAGGPGAKPLGEIARSTQLALDRGEGLRIDPMF